MYVYLLFLFFFFKQKTAYELRISDWSSDVCSSDLDSQGRPMGAIAVRRQGIAPMGRSCSLGSARDTAPYGSPAHCRASLRGDPGMLESVQPNPTSFCPIDSPIDGRIGGTPRSEERRVGKECVSTGRSRGWRYH